MLAEGLVRINKNPSRHDLRMFAAVWFPLFCGLFGVLVWRKSGSLDAPEIIWSVGAALSLVSFFVLPLARLLSLALAYATFPIGFVVSHIIVTLVFFLVVTPVGLALRLFGHDALHLQFDRSAKSYWTPRPEPPPAESHFHQF